MTNLNNVFANTLLYNHNWPRCSEILDLLSVYRVLHINLYKHPCNTLIINPFLQRKSWHCFIGSGSSSRCRNLFGCYLQGAAVLFCRLAPPWLETFGWTSGDLQTALHPPAPSPPTTLQSVSLTLFFTFLLCLAHVFMGQIIHQSGRRDPVSRHLFVYFLPPPPLRLYSLSVHRSFSKCAPAAVRRSGAAGE